LSCTGLPAFHRDLTNPTQPAPRDSRVAERVAIYLTASWARRAGPRRRGRPVPQSIGRAVDASGAWTHRRRAVPWTKGGPSPHRLRCLEDPHDSMVTTQRA